MNSTPVGRGEERKSGGDGGSTGAAGREEGVQMAGDPPHTQGSLGLVLFFFFLTLLIAPLGSLSPSFAHLLQAGA